MILNFLKYLIREMNLLIFVILPPDNVDGISDEENTGDDNLTESIVIVVPGVIEIEYNTRDEL